MKDINDITRQALAQRKRLAKGTCAHCDSPLAPDSRRLCARHIAAARERSGVRMTHAERRRIWDNVDWSLPRAQIARQTGYTPAYVSIMRRKFQHTNP